MDWSVLKGLVVQYKSWLFYIDICKHKYITAEFSFTLNTTAVFSVCAKL